MTAKKPAFDEVDQHFLASVKVELSRSFEDIPPEALSQLIEQSASKSNIPPTTEAPSFAGRDSQAPTQKLPGLAVDASEILGSLTSTPPTQKLPSLPAMSSLPAQEAQPPGTKLSPPPAEEEELHTAAKPDTPAASETKNPPAKLDAPAASKTAAPPTVSKTVDAPAASETKDPPAKPDAPLYDTNPDGTRITSLMDKISHLFDQRKIIKLLKELEFFEGLPTEDLHNIAQLFEETHFAADTHIIRRGDVGDCMYILIEGAVKIPVVNASTQRAYTITIGPGQVFGEMALLTGEPRFADVIASTDCRCLFLKKDAALKLVQEQPQIARFLTTILGKRLMQSDGIQHVGQYKLLGKLGKGGMAFVYEGYHPDLERTVAIKMLSHELVYQQRFAKLFRREAKTLSTLRHPHIVQFIDAEEAYATFFIIMEKLSGLDLNQRIQREGSISYQETRNILYKVSLALDYAHEHGIIHRDLKPQNIMFDNQGSPKLADFGIAIHTQDPGGDGAPSRSLKGTPAYMAPEQILRKPLDHRIDIYALGIVVYKMLTGKTPFTGSLQEVLRAHIETPLPSLRLHDPDVPDDIEEFVQKATAKNPNARFQNCKEIAAYFQPPPIENPLGELKLKTLTFVYSPAQQELIEEAIQKCKDALAGQDDILIQ